MRYCLNCGEKLKKIIEKDGIVNYACVNQECQVSLYTATIDISKLKDIDVYNLIIGIE